MRFSYQTVAILLWSRGTTSLAPVHFAERSVNTARGSATVVYLGYGGERRVFQKHCHLDGIKRNFGTVQRGFKKLS